MPPRRASKQNRKRAAPPASEEKMDTREPSNFGPPPSSSSDSGDDSDVIIVEPTDPPELSPEQKFKKAAEAKEAGNIFFKKGDYANATRLYSQAIELDDKNVTYLNNRAASYIQDKKYKFAMEDCLRAMALSSGAGNPPEPKTLARLAKCQFNLGLLSQASQTMSTLIPLDSSPGTMALKGQVDQLAQTVKNIQRDRENKNWNMVSLGINNAAKDMVELPREWKIWRIEAMLGKKQWDQASSLAAEILRSNRQQPDALYYRALALYYLGNNAQAIAHCQEALRNDPDYSLARLLLKKIKLLESTKEAGNAAFKAGSLDEAIQKYTEALEIDPENSSSNAVFLSNRAIAYVKKEEHDKALEDVRACLAIQETYWKAIRTRARIYIARSEWESAINDFKQALQHAPAGPDSNGLQKELESAEVELKKSKMKDHYKTLGVSKDATDSEIKKAYRKQSLIHHPDKGGNDEKFKEIGEAYAILSDPQRRRKFDMGIDESDPTGGMGGGMGGFGGGGMRFEDFAQFGGGGFPHAGFGFGGGGGFSGGGFGGYSGFGQYGDSD